MFQKSRVSSLATAERLYFQGSPDSNTHIIYCWLIGVDCDTYLAQHFHHYIYFILISSKDDLESTLYIQDNIQVSGKLVKGDEGG